MIWLAYDGKRWEALFEVYEVKGVRVSLGLILFDIKPSSLGFIALRTPFNRDPYHWAPLTQGDPDTLLWGNPASCVSLLSVSPSWVSTNIAGSTKTAGKP
jgi:hypothetical protein